MKIQGLIALSQKFVTDNAPTILTGSSVVGVVGTAVLAGRTGYAAHRQLEKHVMDSEYTIKAKIFDLAPLYVPPVVAGGLTISAILFNHKINAQRLAAMAAVYALSDGKLKDYKAKVEELMGIEKKTEVEKAVANDKMGEAERTSPKFVMIGGEESLFYDIYSGRPFWSTVARIDAAVNEINATVITHNYATIGAFWRAIGLTPAAMSDDMGFDVDNMLEVEYTPHQDENDRPYLMVDYTPVNIRGLVHRGS